jgi:xylan 1,4-beta-xylosidase
MRGGVLAWARLMLSGLALSAQAASAEQSFPVTIRVDPAKAVGPLPPVWRFFGADEPNYATMPHGEKLLMELGALRPGAVYFRAHNLLTTGDGSASFKWGSTNIYTERGGKPVYDFHIVDRIIDTYRARGLHPYLEIGFMPEALSAAPAGTPYRRPWSANGPKGAGTGGWDYPPRDYARWAELVYQWTRHNVARYGRAEVEQWYFEVWNEPNLDFYWAGKADEFFKLHDYAVDAVRRALPTARVGGPDVAGSGGAFMDAFLAHVTSGTNDATGKIGTPTDFLSFHAKGQPALVDGHVRMGISNQLKTADEAFAKIAAVPALAGKPIVIGENDPEGCAACPGPANAYRNGTMYSSYTAATYARLWALARKRHVDLEGALSWAFTFVGQPWFAGYRQLSTNGVDLPVLNVFRLLARLGPEQVAASSDAEVPLATIVSEGVRGKPDVGALATKAPSGRLTLLLWHYHDDDVDGPAAAVRIGVAGLTGSAVARLWRVDREHADAFSAWQHMGSPDHPTRAQVHRLEDASMLRPEVVTLHGGMIDVLVPRQGVALIEIG